MRNKTVIITGAGRDMGLETVVAYAEADAVVYCLDVAEKPSEKWERCRVWAERLPELPDDQGLLRALGETWKKARLEYVWCDVTQYKITQGLADRIVDMEGGIDVCVICAGILQSLGILECDEENVDKVRCRVISNAMTHDHIRNFSICK